MADILKPQKINNIWAENGLKSEPTNSKIDLGWEVEKPPYQVENWVENKQDKFNAHVNQHGIPYKDNETEYQAGKSYVVDPISGIVYKCIFTHVNQPVSNPAYWDIAFSPYEAMVPTGTTQFFAGFSAPRGWLIADGSAVSRALYPTLFSVIGTAYGAGDGSTTFNLPDLRGVAVRGVDRGRNLDPGRTQGTYQPDLFASHSHANTATTVAAGGHSHSYSGTTSSAGEHIHSKQVPSLGGSTDPYSGDYAPWGDVFRSNVVVSTGSAGQHTHTYSGSTTPAGEHTHPVTINNALTGGSETRMKNIALLGIIKF